LRFKSIMKKLIVLFLTFLYLGTATGFTLHLHYCMGEVVNWEVTKADQGHCENCGMDKNKSTKNGCCKDEFKKVKTDDSRKLTENTFSNPLLSVAVLNEGVTYDFSAASYPNFLETSNQSNAPPRSKPVPVYILHCSYLI
jgi:hypothetical protein